MEIQLLKQEIELNMVELGMIPGQKKEGDYQERLEVKEIVEENIKTKLQFMKKGKSKNLLMALWNILIGERSKEIQDKYVLIVGKNK